MADRDEAWRDLAAAAATHAQCRKIQAQVGELIAASLDTPAAQQLHELLSGQPARVRRALRAQALPTPTRSLRLISDQHPEAGDVA